MEILPVGSQVENAVKSPHHGLVDKKNMVVVRRDFRDL